MAVVSSLLVSYVRARAEIIGLEMREGLFSRAPRVILMSLFLILEPLWHDSVTAMLWILAVLASLTVVQRLALVWLKSQETGKRKTENGETAA